MSNLDVYTEHWLDQGGQQDPASKAWTDLHDDDVADSQRLHGPTRLDRESADMDADVQQAVAEARARDVDRDDWAESSQHRTWLSERYPDAKLEDYAKGMLDWNKKFQENPYAAKEQWIRSWAAAPPFRYKSKSAAKSEAVPEGTPERWADGIQREIDVRNGYREAMKDKLDRDGFASSIETRQAIRQQTGLSLSEFLDVCRQITEASATDAASVANRFAQFSGAASTQQQAAEMQHAAQAQALHDHLSAGYARVIQSGKLPGAGTPKVDAAIVAVLEDPRFQRSGDYGVDLEGAYRVAIEWLASGWSPDQAAAQAAPKRAPDDGADATLVVTHPGNEGAFQELQAATDRLQARVVADKAKRASRSISGSPSPGAVSGGQRHDASVEDDTRRAYRSASGI